MDYELRFSILVRVSLRDQKSCFQQSIFESQHETNRKKIGKLGEKTGQKNNTFKKKKGKKDVNIQRSLNQMREREKRGKD